MARVGDEAAARLLSRLQAVGHGVELHGKIVYLVVAADLGVMAVRALSHLLHRLGQNAEAPCQHAR